MIERFFRDSAWLFVMEILVRFKALIVLPILTRQLGAADFGVWSQVSVLTAMLVPIAILGTDAAMMRYLPGQPLPEQARRFSAMLLFILASASLLAASLYLLRGPLANLFFGGDVRYAELIPLAALSLLTAAGIASLRAWWRIRNDAKRFGVIAVAQGMLGIAAVLVAIVGGGDVIAIISWTIAGDALLLVVLAVFLARGRVWSAPDWSVLRPYIRFGVVVLPAGFAMWGINYVDRLFLLNYSSIATVGIYALAYSLASLFVQVVTGPIFAMYATSAAQLHAQQEHASLQRLFDRSLEAIFLLASPVIAILLFNGKDMLTLLATPEFVGGAIVLPIVAAGNVLLVVSAYFETSLGLDNKPQFGTYAAIAALASNLLLNLLLIPPFGMIGAAVATLACFVVQISISYGYCRRGNLLAVSLRYPPHALVCAAIAFGVAGMAGAEIANIWLRLILSCGLGLIAYVLLLYVSGGLPPELRRWLAGRAALFIGQGKWAKRI
ncbi:MAG: oligosaccharide flippase family protein [Pseudomonadota bacterium]|nr:oligosaccharide flippase family protein [Pseudomonadota bacterium]